MFSNIGNLLSGNIPSGVLPRVNREASLYNDNIAKHIEKKSSETSGLPPIIDVMLKNDTLGGLAVTRDLIQKIGTKDPETASRLTTDLEPVIQKHTSNIQQTVENRYDWR